MTLGQKIKELRTQRDWTQNELAKRTNLGRGYLAQLEANIVAKPSADTFLKLARAFNIRPEELYQAAGYIKDARGISQQKETPHELLERVRITLPESVPIYEEFTLHAGRPIEAIDYIPVVRDQARGKNLEGYIVHGKCLEPEINDGDIIIIDRDGQIEHGNIVACLVQGELHLARLRKIADELFLESNERRIKLDEAQIAAPVIEVRRRLK